MKIAFRDALDGYYEYDWDGISPLPKWVAGLTECPLALPPVPTLATSVYRVKELRRSSLDKFVKNSPGISRVYSENYYAATEFQAGRPDSMMVCGVTAATYLLNVGQHLGMTATQFAAYIIDENRGTVGLAIKVSEIEAEYVRLVYSAMPAMTAQQAEQAVTDYTAFCSARTP